VHREPLCLLLVEDNPGDARLILEMLADEWGRQAFSLETAATAADAMVRLQTAMPDLVLLDLTLPDSTGLDTIRRVQASLPQVPVIVLTGNQDRELALSAVKEGAQDFLVKTGLTSGLLVRSIRYALERKQIETSLRLNEARFRSLAELSSDWYWEQDAQGLIQSVSAGLLLKSGVEPSRLTGRNWWTIEGLDADGGWEQLQDRIASHAPFHDLLLRYDASPTETVFLSISGVPFATDRGQFAGYRGVGRDVSARARVDAALRDSEERYRSMMDSARDGILMIDADGVITFANRRLGEMLGRPESEVCGRKLSDFVVPAAETASGGLQLQRKDGTTLWAMHAQYPVAAKDGAHVGTLSLLTDLAEFEAREERVRELAGLAAMKREAERVSAEKSRFLATVSHDLRQPLHAIGLFLEDLRNAGLAPRESQLLDKMGSALELSNGLLDTILLMSSLDSGRVTPNVTAFPLQRVMGRAFQAFGPLAERRGLRLSVLPTTWLVRSDAVLLERIVFNLLSNALKYTDHGGVVLGCRRRGNDIRIEVWDTGLGIPDRFRDDIFREFFCIEGDDRRRGGLGLGLAIVKSSAALLGHRVELASRPGAGSRFTVIVPRAEAMDTLETRPPQPVEPAEVDSGESFAGTTVLVVDDDPLLLEGTSGLLRRWDCRVHTAASCKEAEAVMRALDGRVDLIVSDLRLDGDQTGIDLVHRLRSTFKSAVPAMILTGDRSVQVAREVKRNGLMALYKPAPPGRLRTLMTQLLPRPAGSVPDACAPSDSPAAPAQAA
jgi:PAS domain S-box-containing protein